MTHTTNMNDAKDCVLHTTKKVHMKNTPHTLLKLVVWMGLLSSSSQLVYAQTLMLSRIQSVSETPTQTDMRLDFNTLPPQVQAYQVENPARLVLDLPLTHSKLTTSLVNLTKKSFAKNYTVTDSADRTRVVFTLDKKASFTTRIQDKSLLVSIMSPAVAPKTAKTTTTEVKPTPIVLPKETVKTNELKPVPVQATLEPQEEVNDPAEKNPVVILAPKSIFNTPTTTTPPSTQPAVVVGQQATSYRVSNIDFKRNGPDEANVIVSLNNGNIPVDIKQQGDKIYARFVGNRFPERLRRRLNVSDFNTPINSIDAYNEGSNGIIVIQTTGAIEHKSYQNDTRLVIAVSKPSIKKIGVDIRKATVYKGDKLSLNFQDIEVRTVLSLIAEFTRTNLVASDSVKDKITINLQNVPWDQALDIVLKTKGLGKRVNGNVILIAPSAELDTIEKNEIQAQTQQEQLAPMITEYIQLSFAKATDVVALINASGSNKSSSGGVGGNTASNNNGLLSSRGSLSVDARTNTLILQDTADRLDEIKLLVAKIDVPVRQVMIEARIVKATDSFSKELGVKWGILSKGTASNRSLLVGGSETTLYNLRNPSLSSTGGVSYTIDRPSNLSVDMGVSGANASRLALGLINMSDLMIDLELSALQADGKGEVIATPKVMTLDKQKARVASGTQIPYSKTSLTGVATTEFKNAELSLEVTPNITPDGRIGMELFVNSDSPGAAVGNGDISINTNRIETSVLVDDGQTVVLGGIFQNQISNSTFKTPFLGDLPMLGRLFRKDVRRNDKQELLIFVTPRLVKASTKID